LYYLLFPQPYYPPQARRTYPSVYRKAAGASTDAAVLHDRLLYQDTDWMEVEGAYVREVLGQSLRWLGFTEVGGDPEKSEVFRLTSIGQYLFLGVPLPSVAPAQQGRAAIVQPNFEIVIVDATANLRLVAQLDIFAERRNLDRAATYQLTQAAIVRGLDQGWTGQRAIETLETANGGPLPQNVRYSLDQWVRLYEQLTLYEGVTLLEADGQRQLDRWLDNTKLAPLLGKQLGPTAVLLPAANAERVLKRLDLMSDTAAAFDYAAAPANVLRLREPDQIELLAGRDDPYLRYRLEALGERVEENRQSIIYRMTAQQLRASGEQGWNGQRLLGFLQTAAGGEVPEEFRLRLLGWSGAVPPLPAEALVAVSIPTTAVSWPELRQIPAIGRLLRAVLSDQVALIAGADREALRKVLAERGLQVQDGRLAEAVLAPAKPEADLKALIKQHRGDPESVYEALKSAGLIAKLYHIRWRSR
ncbi:MAG: helicase-associated domain-containing protein, partial [Dehalococcoidia bacterium]